MDTYEITLERKDWLTVLRALGTAEVMHRMIATDGAIVDFAVTNYHAKGADDCQRIKYDLDRQMEEYDLNLAKEVSEE